MSWAEFQIRAFAYNRMEERKDLRAREIAWASLIAFHQDPKRMPKSKDRFWSIGKQRGNIITDGQKRRILEAQKQFNKDVKGG
jgi:hypothetical protein